MADNILIRTLRPDETQIPIDWARDEGWNPGIHDATSHYAVDPQGWFCAEKNGEVIGVIVGTNYDSSFSFGGFYIVKKPYQNQGFGWSLWQRMTDHFGDRNYAIDGVFEMQNKYAARTGLKFAYRDIRWQGIASARGCEDLIPAVDVQFDILLAYDTAHFPSRRRAFLERWIRQPEGTALVKTGPGDSVLGYGVIRRCFEGHKIGPLFADTREIAEEIFDGLTATVPGETIFFDTPEPNQDAVRMARERGMTEVFGTARMYLKTIPRLPIPEIFGVTTFELG